LHVVFFAIQRLLVPELVPSRTSQNEEFTELAVELTFGGRAMELTDPQDIYAYQLGAVWGRLLGLEALLRVAISGGNFKAPFDVSVGDEMETDALNRWGYLSELIRQYNLLVATSRPECVLVAGDDILRLRNALAHGIAVLIGRDGDPEPAAARG
jgi:hypothetical protein